MVSSKTIWLFSLASPLISASQVFFDQQLESIAATSPIQVRLERSEVAGSIRAIVQNQGSQSVVLHGFLPSVHVFTAENEPAEFSGFSDGFYDQISNFTQSDILGAGASKVFNVEIGSKYTMLPGNTYFGQAGGFVEYEVAGQSSKAQQTASYESNMLEIDTPMQRLPKFAKTNHVPLSNKYVWTGCTDKALDQKLKASIPIAIKMAKGAAEHAMNGKNRAAFTAYFKRDSPENRKTVADRFTAMAKSLSTEGGVTRLGCGEGARSVCAQGNPNALAWTVARTGVVTFCAKSKSYPVEVSKCTNANLPGVLVHELSHSAALYKPNTIDSAMSNVQCKGLSEAKALLNANNFNLYAQSVMFNTVC